MGIKLSPEKTAERVRKMNATKAAKKAEREARGDGKKPAKKRAAKTSKKGHDLVVGSYPHSFDQEPKGPIRTMVVPNVSLAIDMMKLAIRALEGR